MMHRLAVLLLALAGALAVPGPAAASGSQTDDFDVFEPITVDPATGAMSSSVPEWATSGDCSMFPDSTVVIAAPNL
jgi:hypothetical protein